MINSTSVGLTDRNFVVLQVDLIFEQGQFIFFYPEKFP